MDDHRHPFGRMMALTGFEPIRDIHGIPFRWNTHLNGLWWDRLRDWRQGATQLGLFLEQVPVIDRNVIAHSHGGQLPLFLAASGFRLNSLTTVSTPRHHRVPAEDALPYIGYWQHIHDVRFDFIQSLRPRLGQVGDWVISTERRFLLPGVQNHGERGIRHSRVLETGPEIELWIQRGWLDAIKRAGRC